MDRKCFLLLIIGLIIFPLIQAQAIEIENPVEAETIDELVENIINFIFYLALLIAPIMFIIAGLAFITAAGDLAKVQRAKDIVLWTVIGLVIVLLAKGIIAIIKEIFET